MLSLGPGAACAGPGFIPGHIMTPTPTPHHRRARAFTLVEVVLAAVLAAMVMIGLQSAVLIASRAVPASGAPTGVAAQAAALERIARDLSYATRITGSTSASITFTVPDRTSDAADDTVEFRWTGVPGDPLTRTINASAPETILPDVRSLSLSLTTTSATADQTYTDSAETLLSSYASATSLTTATLTATDFIAQLAPITLPNTAVDFRITRARFTLGISGSATGSGRVEIRPVCNSLPGLPAFAVGNFYEPFGSTTANVSLGMTQYIDPAEPLIFVIRYATNAPAGTVTYRSSGVTTASAALLTSADAGATWTSNSARSLIYELWGVYRTRDDPRTITASTRLRVTVRSSTANATEFSLPLPAHPEVGP